jgi:hypothetical protein
MGKNKKQTLNISEHGDVIILWDGVAIHPVTTKIQVSERKETTQRFHHGANGDFKTVIEFNGCGRRKLKTDQQHCSCSKILTSMKEACTEYKYSMFAIRH